MSPTSAPEYLYLTTIGWKTGNPHEIEIWFTELEGRFYMISELGRPGPLGAERGATI